MIAVSALWARNFFSSAAKASATSRCWRRLRALTDPSAQFIPPGLFPAAGLTCGETYYLRTAQAASSASARLVASAQQSQTAQHRSRLELRLLPTRRRHN